jgi:hypothetical protein
MMEIQLNSNSIRSCLLAVLLCSGMSSLAEESLDEETQSATSLELSREIESSEVEPGNDDTEPNGRAVEEPTQQTEEGSLAKTPQAENLKNRDLGAAFRTFRPSEEISADNAVPYPVDI